MKISDTQPLEPLPKLNLLEIREREEIVRQLRRHQGNHSAAARSCGIGHTTLYRKIARFVIGPQDWAFPPSSMSELVWQPFSRGGRRAVGVLGLWLCSLLLCFGQSSQTWTLAWFRNVEPEVIGYKLYQRIGTNWQCIGQTFGTNFGPVGPGCYAVTAYAEFGESTHSTNVCAVSVPICITLVSTGVTTTTITTVTTKP